MRPSGWWRLYRRRLRARSVQELLAILGIAGGVALTFAAIVAATSLTGSIQQLTNGIVGDARLQLIARSPNGIDARMLDAVERVDGVEQAAPLLEARAQLVGPTSETSVTLVGGEPRFAKLGGALVRQFSAAELARQRAVALPAPMADRLGLSLYSPVTIETGAGTTRLPLGARLQTSEIGTLVHSPVAIMPLAAAQEVTGLQGRVTRIYVKPASGQDATVRAALERIAGDHANVRAADADADLFRQASYATNQSTLMFATLAALVGFFFAVAAVWLTLPQRRAVVAALRKAGYAPAAIAIVILLDAVLLGLAGAVAGLLLGDLLSRQIDSGVPGYLATGWPIGEQRIVTWWAIAGAGLAGIAAACGAVVLALTDATVRPRPVHAPRRANAPAAGGLVLIAAAGVIAAAAPRLALAGLIATGIGLLLLLPTCLRAATAALGFVTSRLRPAGVWKLAELELRSTATNARTIALTATGAIAVFAVVAIGGARADLVRGLDGSGRDVDDNADVWVTSSDATSTFAVTPFRVPSETVTRLRRLPGVESVSIYRGGFHDIGDRRVWVQAPPRDAPAPVPPGQLLTGDLAAATAEIRASGAVVLSRALADAENVDIGDHVTLPTTHPTRLRIAAISNNLGWPSGAVILNADDYARAWGVTAPSALQIHTADGVAPAAVARAARRTLDGEVAVTVETREQRRQLHRDATHQGLVRLNQIAVLVLVIAMLSMAAATAGAIWQRRPAIARYRTHGYYGELWGALLIESAVLLGTGCLAGAAAGLLGQRLLTSALLTITGFPVAYAAAAAIAIGIVTLVTAAALAIIAIPGWLATRLAPPARTA